MRGLIGRTGFVGGALAAALPFDRAYRSTDIAAIRGERFDELIVAGAPGAMWAANANPEADRANLLSLFELLRSVSVRRLALVSSIAVYADPAAGPDEASEAFETRLAYGRNRREFEALIEDAFPQALILRLPALFGPGLRKNFIFDLLNPVPSFLNEAARARLEAAATGPTRGLVGALYERDAQNGLWRFARERAGAEDSRALEALCRSLKMEAARFVNSDSVFQFYDLARLPEDIARGFACGARRLNLAAAPLRASAAALALTGEMFENAGPPVILQDMRSRWDAAWGRSDGRLHGEAETLEALRAFGAAARSAAS